MSLFARMVAGMAAGDIDALFIAESHSAVSAGTATVSYTGALAGDLAVLILNQAGSAPSGWTAAGAGVSWGANSANVCYKVLTGADISAGSLTVSGTNGGVVLLSIYRNVTVAAAVSTATTAGATSLAIPGFTRSKSSKGIVPFGLFNGAAGTITPPPEGTSRLQGSLGSYIVAVTTILPAAQYLDGSPLNWAWTSSNNAMVQALELT